MATRERGRRGSSLPAGPEVYNIIPIHDLLTDHPSQRYPEVRAAAAALRNVSNLRKHPYVSWDRQMDLMDWLGTLFGFQSGNIRNQREHLVLHLANCQMRLEPPPAIPDSLDPKVLSRFRRKLLSNYTSWCSYVRRRSQVVLSGKRLQKPNANIINSSNVVSQNESFRRELLYVSLYLLIWGEAGNLRFTPELICYIYHHLAMELNWFLDEWIDPQTGRAFLPSVSGECAFLKSIVMPFYETVKNEVDSSKNGTKPHSAWRNYDDINEFFWTRRCFRKLDWPINLSSNFFSTTEKSKRVGKTGFVEQRSFWNLFRSFDKVWVLLVLFFQASLIVAWAGTDYPWQALESRDVQVELLTCFISWAFLRFVVAVLDAGMQYSLVTKETLILGVRMGLKCCVAAAWTILFSVLYWNIWREKNSARHWNAEANKKIILFLEVVFVFLIPELLALILLFLPWIRNAIEELDWRVLYLFTWWFYRRTFVGRGLREGVITSSKYAIFWIVILISKFTFSYFLQIKPLVSPTKVLLNAKIVSYQWHEFFSSSNNFAVIMMWLPVVLIYFMDLQIWYSVVSSIVGSAIGLFSHLGEIRNIEQLRLRFQFFASAMQFNLMPEELVLSGEMTLVKKLRDAISRVKLRYGLGQPYKKIESSQVEATRFALIWNEIITTFREEDLISDKEFELLELPPNSWNIRVVRWPCILLCNELLLAVNQATELADGPDTMIWLKVSKNEYMRCALIEAYDSIKSLLLSILKPRTDESVIVSNFFERVDGYIQIERFTEAYKLHLLPKIHKNIASLVGQLMRPEKDVNRIVNILQALYEQCIREFPKIKRSVEELRQEGLAPQSPLMREGLLFENAIVFPEVENEFFYRQVRRLHTILTSKDSMHDVPQNIEARRRISFFSNSLFMNMPHASTVEKMMAFSVLTPYYDEDVCFGKEHLRSLNEDGVSIIFYLQKIYEDEWRNFMERMRRDGMENDEEIWNKRSRDLRLWASHRGQTLSRTVRGMMYYYRALQMLSYLDSASEMDIRTGTEKIASHHSIGATSGYFGQNMVRPNRLRKLTKATSNVSILFKGHELGCAMMKFTYVVACQLYGQHKAKGDHRAEEILYLMKQNEALRVAYVDEVKVGRDEMEYYSVLVKYDQQLQKEAEIYRIRLPGPLKLGEGKPENQNHAIIFTRGDALQTIDMNQDNYFEEAVKMRNLLEEFKRSYGIKKPTILGVRENIFTGSVSSLAWFMSAQETSFVTLGQRVLANPLKIRMHYGHPDVFDRFWFLQRGGISKASKVINISEDIYAGFNCTLRGGNVTHHEYIQVGKGRDVGLNQISMFEAKVASGNGEQILSRDVYRLGHRLDFFRMLSFYYTTVGFYFNTMIVILTVYAFLWGRLYLGLSGVESYAMNHNSNKAFSTILNQQFVLQLGLFTALPMIVENALEQGYLPAVKEFVTMQLQLASLFYTFSMGTRSHYFGRTILHGGAKYRATGRGFVVQHKSFAENYRLYARSHFVKAVELGVILVVYATHSKLARNSFVYIALTISCWFLVISWLMSPFVFNPSGFDWLKLVNDFEDFINWLWASSGTFTKAEQSWETWWYEEQDHLRNTGLWGKLLEIILDLRFFFFQYGVVYQLNIAGGDTSITVYLISWVFMVVMVALYVGLAFARDRYAATEHSKYRLAQLLIVFIITLVIVVLLETTDFVLLDLVLSLLAFVPTGYGLISIAQVLRPFLQSTIAWDTVVALARLYDLLLGVTVMVPLTFFSWLPEFQAMQTRILFNEAFSRGLQISQLLAGKKSD